MFEKKKETKEGFPDFSDVKKMVESNFSPEQIKEVRNMLKGLGYTVEENVSTYDTDLQQVLINLQKKYGNAHPSLLDVAVQ
jgi:N-acetyl-anhydromuramyl-L-alanine amidase AmpD